MNQDYALARWREDSDRTFPEQYAVKDGMVYMSINGNDGWYIPVFVGESLVSLTSEAAPGIWELVRFVNPQRAARIREAVMASAA